MEKVTFVSPVPNSGYVARNGKRAIFVGKGKFGYLTTDNETLIAELDAAIKAGNRLWRESQQHAVHVPELTPTQRALENLKASRGIPATLNGVLSTAVINAAPEGSADDAPLNTEAPADE